MKLALRKIRTNTKIQTRTQLDVSTWKFHFLDRSHYFSFQARDAGAVIHSHSKSAVLVTLLFPEEVFRLSHFEMIKVR